MLSLDLLFILFAIALFLSMMACAEAGYRIGLHRARTNPAALKGAGPIEAAIFGLLGLILAFSFSGAQDRLETRRHLVVEEANAIGTAYLRLDLLPPADQPELRHLFRQYLHARLEAYAKIPDLKAAEEQLAEAEKLQKTIWSRAVAASHKEPPSVPLLVLPALNSMIDITTTRTRAAFTHISPVIIGLLFVLALFSAVLIGHSMAAATCRNLLYIAAYALLVALTIYVIIDLEYPRIGFIRITAADKVLIDLRNSIQ